MMTRFFRNACLAGGALAAALTLFACGGGGGGSSVADGGIGGSGIVSAGSITAKGSITVNGVRYSTAGARYLREGEAEQILDEVADDVQLGMVVRVDGSVADDGRNGTASTITFEDILEGPVSSVTGNNPALVKVLEVLGQIVVVENGVTRFDDSVPGFGFDSLVNGMAGVIEVSGFIKPDGTIQATYIRQSAGDLSQFLAAGNELEVMGAVDERPATTTLRINGLLVDFAGAQLDNVPAGGPAVGQTVEVKGSAFAGATLIADRLELKVLGLGDNQPKAEIEGFIEGIDRTAQTFRLNGQLVSYAGAQLEGGLPVDLADGVKVEAEGPIVGAVLQAVKIEFEESIRIEAIADQVNTAAGTLTLRGLSGITVQIDEQLTAPDSDDLAQIASGDSLKIRGRQIGPMTLVATRFEEVSPSADASLQGEVESADPAGGGTVVILGFAVDTGTVPDSGFKEEEVIIGRNAFFTRLAQNAATVVEAKGSYSGASILWDEMEIEQEE